MDATVPDRASVQPSDEDLYAAAQHPDSQRIEVRDAAGNWTESRHRPEAWLSFFEFFTPLTRVHLYRIVDVDGPHLRPSAVELLAASQDETKRVEIRLPGGWEPSLASPDAWRCYLNALGPDAPLGDYRIVDTSSTEGGA